MDSELRKEFKRLSKLHTMKEKSEDYIKHEAQKNVTVREMVRTGNFIDDDEKKFAKSLFDKYLDNYDFENMVDLNTLGILVFNEVLVQRVQKTINAQQDSKGNFYLNDKMVKSLHDTQNHVLELKKQLGLDKEKTESELTAWQQANKKLDLHIAFNRNEYSTTCIAEDSLILMSDLTTRKIQDIEIGDEILGLEQVNYSWKVKKQKVLNKFDNGFKEVIKIKAGKNELELTPDHKILAEVCRKKPGTDTRYFEVQQCFGRNVKIFNYIVDLDYYYRGVLLGLIDSDGWVSKNNDKKHPDWNFEETYHISQKMEHKAVDWILKYFNFTYSKKWNTSGWKDGAFAYRITCQHSEFIRTIKKDLLNNKDIQYGYLCGFLVGDGNRDVNNSWNITQSYKVNQHKIDLIEQILNNNKISYTKYIGCKDRQILNIRVGSCRLPLIFPESKKIATWYKKFIGCKPYFSLDRFKLRFVEIEKEKKVYDLTTETHNFIANGFVVHNCSNCGEPLLLRKKTLGFECLKHPFFSGRFWANARALSLVEKGILSKEDYAFIFHTSVDYVNWVLENKGKLIEIDDFTQEEINNFMQSKDYLKDFVKTKNRTKNK